MTKKEKNKIVFSVLDDMEKHCDEMVNIIMGSNTIDYNSKEFWQCMGIAKIKSYILIYKIAKIS